MENIECFKARLLPAKFGADISNGSERALYVPMKHVFNVLQRPHRAVNLMFTYYPFDHGWPKRSSQIMKWKDGMGQWDLPFDDYDVYLGGPGGSVDAEAFRQFRDVRRFGQDIHFTLTIDLKVPSKTLRHIARDLRPYGRVFFRINHECNGDWFQHNRRNSYKQVSNFFVKFHHIIKEETPLAQTVLCVNGFDEEERMHLGEKDLAGAVCTADILAVDRYLSLHYRWPNAFRGDPLAYYDLKLENWWKTMLLNYRQLCEVRGDDSFPFSLPELNADSDVNGYAGQARKISEMYKMISQKGKEWISSVTMYQFRDRGGLGLELEDQRTHEFLKRLPACNAYKKAVTEPCYMPSIKKGGVIDETRFPITLKWYNSEDAEGLSIRGIRPKGSNRLSIVLEKGNYLIECNGKWFHTEGGSLDLKKTVLQGEAYSINIFAPPKDGVNSIAPDGSYLPYYQTAIYEIPRIVN